MPIVMDHIATVGLLSERVSGVVKQAQNAVYINVSSGVSAGLMINGQIYRGILGNAGEFGHIVIDPEGEICVDCGRRGCLENISSVFAVINAAKAKGFEIPDHLDRYESIKFLGEAALNGDEMAKTCFSQAIYGMVEGVTDLVNILNLELVVLGGKVIRAYPPFVEEVAKRVMDQCWPFSRQRLSIVSASSAENRLLHGAVSMILEEVFSSYAINGNGTSVSETI